MFRQKIYPMESNTNYLKISSFDNIKINDHLKPLIICDIDETLLYFDRSYDKYYKMMKKDNPDFSEDEIKELAQGMYDMSVMVLKAQHTDENGFINMYNNVKKLNDKIIFLTARNSSGDKTTKKHLKDVGINDLFGSETDAETKIEIHYTNNAVTKGEYIKNNIMTTIVRENEFTQIIFIDDYDSSIQSVLEHLPREIDCYLFERNKNSLMLP
jgi:hypothetical protein